MNAYPDDYVFHNLPLLVLSGLDDGSQSEPATNSRTHAFLQEGGFRIKTDIPAVKSPLAEQLLRSFRRQDASTISWHSRSVTARNGKVFKISNVGRVGQDSPPGSL